ncbi:MAG: hypothetical protein LBC74_05540, partial [Planctomycetaceae bacterium]|nr:hypothetical protein [Planctomycetaceae bacterium]
DENKYKKGIKVTDDELKKINIKNHKFQGDWNYTINAAKKIKKNNLDRLFSRAALPI